MYVCLTIIRRQCELYACDSILESAFLSVCVRDYVSVWRGVCVCVHVSVFECLFV